MLSDPIVILGAPGSGADIVAEIFRRHGVWWSDAILSIYRVSNPQLDSTGASPLPTHRALVRDCIEEVVKEDGYKKGPWLTCHEAGYWRMYRGWQKPKFVMVAPSLDEVGQAYLTRGHDLTEKIRNEIEWHGVSGERVNIFADEVVTGMHGRLRAAFEMCGIPFDDAIARSVVDGGLKSAA